ncbi:MAG: spore coat associated protein CotJA [Lachnospiraceae bacterium]
MPAFRPEEFPVAMAYVPWQRWNTVYDLERALSTGTIFPELDKPFYGVRGGCR